MPSADQFDPRIYGGQAPNNDPVPTIIPKPQAVVEPVVAPAQASLADTASKGLPSVAIGQAAVLENSRIPATPLESAKAAFSSMTPFRVMDYVNQPKFSDEPGFDVTPYMEVLKFTPSETEDKFLRTAKSEAAFSYRRDQIEEQRKMQQAMGDNPLLSLVVSVADPVYLAIDTVALGTGRLAQIAGMSARAARLTAGAVAVGGAYGLGKVEQQVYAVSDTEVVLNAALNGAASALVYRGGKYVPSDIKYPAQQVADVANDLKRTIPTPVETAVRSESEAVAAATVQRQQKAQALAESISPTASRADAAAPLSGTGAKPMPGGVRMTARQVLETIADFPLEKGVGEFGLLAKELLRLGGASLENMPVKQIATPDTARAAYNPDSHQILTDLRDLGKRNAAQAAVHEISHGLTVQKIYYGLENPSTAIGKLVSELEDLRKLTIREADRQGVFPGASNERYLTKDPMEFTAGLFWGRGEFTEFLSKIKIAGEVNALSKMVNTVRKLLGLTRDKQSVLTRALDIKEQLIAEPLSILLPSGRPLTFAPNLTGNVAGQIIKNEESLASKVGNKISISLHKSLASLGEEARKVSDLLFDDPVNMRGDSVASQVRAVRADLSAKQYEFEELFADALAERGAGVWHRIWKEQASSATQIKLERELTMEMLERQRYASTGTVPPARVDNEVTRMADALDRMYAAALAEQKAAGVPGAEDIAEKAGYFPRKWDSAKQDEILGRLRASGMTEKAAQKALDHTVARGISRMNPNMTEEVAQDVAHAILARSRAKGYFEDVVFRRHIGNEAAKELREILTGSGIRGDRLERAMDALTGAVDEAGKPSTLKRRIDIDMRYGIQVPGTAETVRIADLLDTSMTRIADGYLDKAAANSAFARKGMPDATSLDNVRTKLLKSIPNEVKRKRAAYLFDNGVALLKGNPVGEDMHEFMRNTQAITQMVGLGSSGLWQLTEIAPIMSQYGAVKTTREIIRTMPGFGSMMDSLVKDKDLATHLSNVLTRNASQDVRIRPYITKLEDNFDMPIGNGVGMSLMQAKQLVPYINGMKYIQKWQAKMVGNLIADTFERAAKGNKGAREALEKVGLESQTMDGIKADILTHGLDTAKWSDTTWQAVRGPLNKMVDDSILRARVGEVPAFAQFSQVGKFVFTFRNFVLTAHNKILAGTLGREGFAGLGLLMAYQYPLTLLATAVNHSISGKSEPKTLEELAAMSLSQMGAMGLLGEFAGVISGNKQQFGAPGLIAIDRMYKAVGAVGTELRGGEGSPMAALLQAMPILSIIPGSKALAETLKD